MTQTHPDAQLREEDYVFLPLVEATAPTSGSFFQRYADHWWAVHPDRGLLFYNPVNSRTGRRRHGRYGSPQCNSVERITRMVAAKSAEMLWPGVEIRLIPVVWVPVSISDYRD